MRQEHGRAGSAGDGAQAGFALVEVLVSLALAALIGVLMVETVRVAGRTAAAVAVAEGAGEVQAVRDHLRRTLGTLASRHMDGSLPVLQGGPDGLSAAIAPDRVLERPAELVASLAGVPRGGGAFDLVERQIPLETLQGTARTARSEVLLGRIAGVAFQYFGAPAKGLPPAWVAQWGRTDRQPDLVEVRIAFGPADRRRWPPLLIATGGQP
ncbi:general secretion pathway protein GspJ [Methylobacterium sp. J-076]|uniref:general secretion pathway protein GspJ n=1 Tax=Methylobacterium sp. J-076 TaxID=2836655 RepID=UPI001FBB7EE5|nr:general secretion pathway protein GspJ [Methylobacterium sp. J-076]MCJ2015121.1 general secretion pathway protein GspJ [Methylobacterium sp. J-076]